MITFTKKQQKMKEKKQEILSLLKELIRFANADKKYREAEHQFLLAIAQQFDISKTEFQEIFESDIEHIPQKPEYERIVQFQRLVLLMHVDLENSKEEIDKLKEFGVHLGLNPEAINKVLVQMTQYENGVIPPEKLIEIFKTHHN